MIGKLNFVGGSYHDGNSNHEEPVSKRNVIYNLQPGTYYIKYNRSAYENAGDYMLSVEFK